MKQVNYPEINFRITKPIRETTKKEARFYFDWFMSVIDVRIKVLTEFIKKETDCEWEPDFLRESLVTVGVWLSKNAKSREVSFEERRNEIERNKLRGVQAELTMEVDKVLTHETKLRCFDAGIYVGETLRRNNKWNLHWLYNIGPKRLVTLHEPVLSIGKNKVDLCPRMAMEGFASKIVKGMVDESEVLRLYDLWSEMFSLNYKPPHYPD